MSPWSPCSPAWRARRRAIDLPVGDLLGLPAKWGYALAAPGLPADFESRHPLEPDDQERLEHFRAAWGEADPRLAHVAHLDLSTADASSPFLDKLGLVTIARLLSVVEATRTRWVLQHLPYDVAKLARARMGLTNVTVPRALSFWSGRVRS